VADQQGGLADGIKANPDRVGVAVDQENSLWHATVAPRSGLAG
jgi:hypothetical protein